MRQALWIFTFASAFAVALPPDVVKAAVDPKDAIVRARAELANKNPRGAAEVLEDALGASRGGDRSEILNLLRQTYGGLIREAQAAGRAEDAAMYADDLAILEAQPAMGAPAALPAAASPSIAPAPSVAAPPPAPPAAAASPPLSTPTFEPTPVPEPVKASPAPEATPKPTPTPTPTPAPLEGRGAAPAIPRNDKAVDRAGFEAPAPATIAPAPAPASRPAETSSPPLQSPAEEIPAMTAAPKAPRDDKAPAESNPAVATRAEAVAQADGSAAGDLGSADALFTEKKYNEAGKIYADLAMRGRLPSARKKVWAYCRWAVVVARVNAHPRTAAEWDEIETELENIQLLTPGNWYGEYIKDRVAAARRGERLTKPSKPRSGGLVVRGAAPEEPEDSLKLPAGREPAAERSDPTEAAPVPAPAPAPAPADSISTVAAPNWQVHETASFRIFHVDPALAEQAAEAAEAVRARQGTRWGSRAVQTPWSPRCDIYLYPTAADFARMTGQPETSPGFSTMGVGGGRVVARRVNLRADHPRMLSAILPHEVTHVVLADVFPEHQIPRWADEGMAVLAEPADEQAGRAADLNAPMADQRLFKLGQLMAIDYPESQDWNLFYAQSVSLTQFLLRQGTPSQFVAFLKNAQRGGLETAIRETYQFDGLDDLDRRWRDFASRRASPIATADAPPSAGSPAVQR